MRIIAIALTCGAMVCFTGLDTSSKWLGLRIPTMQIVWARFAFLLYAKDGRHENDPAACVHRSVVRGELTPASLRVAMT